MDNISHQFSILKDENGDPCKFESIQSFFYDDEINSIIVGGNQKIIKVDLHNQSIDQSINKSIIYENKSLGEIYGISKLSSEKYVFTDYLNHCVQTIDGDAIWGSPNKSSFDPSSFDRPNGITSIDSSYYAIADCNNHSIRMVHVDSKM